MLRAIVHKFEFWYTKVKLENLFKNSVSWDFPGGPAVKNLPYNTGDVGLIPGQGTRIPHATGHLGPRTTTTELTHLN